MNVINTLPIDKIASVIERLPTALLTLGVCYIFIRLIQWGLSLSLKAARTTKTLHAIIVQTCSVILWIGAIALVLQSIGLNQIAIALSGSIAIIGIGIASGANKLVADIVAGLFLARNRDFKIGEWVEVNDAKGRIHSLDARKVRILGDDGALFIIPNAKFDEVTWKIVPDKEKEKK